MATSYKFNDRNLIRLVFSKAYRSPFILDTYLNSRVQVPTGGGTFQEFVVAGNKDAALVNSTIGTEIDHKFTSKAYGGAHINYNVSSKFNFNVSGYWFSEQTFYHLDNTTYQDDVRGVEHIKGKLIINTKLSYAPVKGLSVFVTGRNLLARKSVEYYRGDATPAMVLGGVSFDL